MRMPAAILPLTALILAGPFLAGGDARTIPPPDLRVEWVGGPAPTRESEVVRGKAGEVRRLDYQIRNVGGAEAFAVILSAQTALGPVLRPTRIQPGPQPGRHLRKTLDLPLAEGMREVCLEVVLQTSNADDPHDPNPQDNRLCRRVEVKEHDHADR